MAGTLYQGPGSVAELSIPSVAAVPGNFMIFACLSAAAVRSLRTIFVGVSVCRVPRGRRCRRSLLSIVRLQGLCGQWTAPISDWAVRGGVVREKRSPVLVLDWGVLTRLVLPALYVP